MSTKRNHANAKLPLALLGLLGLALLVFGLIGNTPAAARSSGGDSGSSQKTLSLNKNLFGIAKQAKTVAGVSTGGSQSRILQLGSGGATVPQSGVGTGLGVPSGVLQGGAAADEAGPLQDIMDAADETSAASSYDFDIQVTDPISGPEEGVGQYVADDMVHVTATDQENQEREAIIWGEEIFVKDPTGQYQALTRDELDSDPTAAARLVSSFVDSPNVFQSLSGLLPAATNVDDQGELQLEGVGVHHYLFDLSGTKFLGTDEDENADPQIFGTGEAFVDLSTNHVYALSYDIDFEAFLNVLFGAFSDTPTETPTPGEAPEVVHLIYNLRLNNFDADPSFERPDVAPAETPTEEAVATETETPAVEPTRTRRATNTPRPTRTPTAAPTDTPHPGISDDVNQMIGDAIDTMTSGLDTYHYDLDAGQNYIDSDGNETNTHLTLQADVENPDRVDMSYESQTSDNGDATIDRTHLIRIGSSVYVNNDQTGNRWKKYALEDIGEENLATVVDVRDVIATAEQVDDEDWGDGVTAHHIVFTLDMEALYGGDLSGIDADGGGDIWIDADSGAMLEMSWSYFLENPDNGARIDYQSDGIYSNFNDPLDIRPPSNR